LGNLMRTDDAVGVLAVRALAEGNLVPPSVLLIEGGTLGLDLLGNLHGLTHILALDAVDAELAPGTLLRFAGDDLTKLPTSKSVHLLGFADLMNVLHLMDAAPEQVILLGVQPASTDWGTTLTPTVEAAQKELVDAALLQISEWLSAAPSLPISDITHISA
jgi:hydrogenase maturation protease